MARVVGLQGEVVVVLARSTLREPKEYSREHQRDVLRDVCVAVICKLLRVSPEDVFQHQHRLISTHMSVGK